MEEVVCNLGLASQNQRIPTWVVLPSLGDRRRRKDEKFLLIIYFTIAVHVIRMEETLD